MSIDLKHMHVFEYEKIVLQIVPIENNDSGCWDWYGYLEDSSDASFGELM